MFYVANGLRVESDVPLVGFEHADEGSPDVKFHASKFPQSAFDALIQSSNLYYSDSSLLAYRSGDQVALRYSDCTDFFIDSSVSTVWAQWGSASACEFAVAYFTGPVLGLLLRMRGTLCLHASAIVAGNAAFAIAGPCGAGKSTLAASFATGRALVLSDDVVALSLGGDGFAVHPSWSRFKLWPDSVKAIFGTDAEFPRLDHSSEKRVVHGTEAGAENAVPLRAVYFLERSDLPGARIDEANPLQAMVSLASHTYCNYLLTPEMRRVEFEQLQQLMKTISVRKLTIPNDYSALPAVREALLADFAEQSRSTVRSC